MPRLLTAGAFAVLLSFSLALPLAAADTAEEFEALQAKAEKALEGERWLSYYIANMKLHDLRPFDPQYMYNVVRACARLGRQTNAYDFMLKMQQQGLSYDFNATPDTEAIRGTEAYDYMNKLLLEAGQPAGAGNVAFGLPGDPADYSVIEWDSSRERFLVGTLGQGQVLAVSPEGESEVLLTAGPENGMWSVTGLAVDAERDRLWVSSSPTDRFQGSSPARKRHGVLFEYSLGGLEQLGSYVLPANMVEHELGRLALTGDGTVYVVDRLNPIVYRKLPEARALEPYVSSKELVRLVDVAVTPDHSRIFVADEMMGVMVVDPVEEMTGWLGLPERSNLGGISSMDFADGHLYITQAGISPQRVMNLTLDPSLAGAETMMPMAVALEPFDGPGAGVVQGGAIWYLANAGSGDSGSGLQVMKTPLESGAGIVAPDVRLFNEELQEDVARRKQEEQ